MESDDYMDLRIGPAETNLQASVDQGIKSFPNIQSIWGQSFKSSIRGKTTTRFIHWGKFGSGHGIIVPMVSFQRRIHSKTLQDGEEKLQRALRKSKITTIMH